MGAPSFEGKPFMLLPLSRDSSAGKERMEKIALFRYQLIPAIPSSG